MYVCGKRFKVHAESMFDVHVTVKVWNQYCFCIFHSTKYYFMVKWRKAHHRLGTSFNMWAAAWQNQQNDLCAEGRRKNSLGICPVWSVFAVCMKNLACLATHWVHSLRWAHRSFCWLHVKSNSTNGTKYKPTNIWTDERKDENYIPLGINAGSIMKKSTS